VRMRTWLPVRVESLWWMRGLRRLLRVVGTLPLVLDPRRREAVGGHWLMNKEASDGCPPRLPCRSYDT
jgi:hypothetical protein